VFGQITPFPATPLYERLEREGRLTRPKHWLEFTPFQMAHTPLKMAPSEVQTEVAAAWTDSYSPEATWQAIDSMADEPVPYKISHMLARLFFRGIYFPQKNTWGWLKQIFQNRRTILRIIGEGFTMWHGAKGKRSRLEFETGAAPAAAPRYAGD
jgi:hypothetical protein